MEHLIDEEILREVVGLLVRFVEAGGAVIIFVGAAVAFVRFVWAALRLRKAETFVPIRLTLGRFLALGLEFQLAGDILSTAVSPTFEEIGQLAAIATIRTGLNYFLAREIKEEREELAMEEEDHKRAGERTAAPKE
ncbi:MAG: DUF1622 domain-containing protein [Actinomycetota bacterium]